jgi:hypothetical protein
MTMQPESRPSSRSPSPSGAGADEAQALGNRADPEGGAGKLLAELRELEAKASPAPWFWWRTVTGADTVQRTVGWVATISERGTTEDAQFIVALRNAAPGLLALLAEQRELIGRLRESIDNLLSRKLTAERERDEARGAADRMREKAEAYDRINSPELYDFVSAVTNEALHQREKWGIDADGWKSDADWFWLIGYLAGKALHNPEKSEMTPTDARLHRIITVAAAAANWHAATLGTYARMRPGTESPDGASRSAGAGTTGEG